MHAQYGSQTPPATSPAVSTSQEMIDHVEMLEEHLTNDDPKKRIKAAEAMSAYIADNAFLPEKMEVACPTVDVDGC